MLKKSQTPSEIKSEIAEVGIIISKGINPGNAVQRSMSSSSKLASLLKPRATERKADEIEKGKPYGECSLEDMGLNPEPPVPVHVDDHKVVFISRSSKEKLKKPQDNEADCNTLSDESPSGIKLG